MDRIGRSREISKEKVEDWERDASQREWREGFVCLATHF